MGELAQAEEQAGPQDQGEWSVLAAAIRLLDERRFATVAQLHAELSSDPACTGPLAADELRKLLRESERIELLADVAFSAASVVAGRTFTARQEPDGTLVSLGDLAPFLGIQRNLAETPEGVPVGSRERTAFIASAIPAEMRIGSSYLAVGGSADLATAEFGSVRPDALKVNAIDSDRLASGEVEVAAVRAAADEIIPAGQGIAVRPLIAYAIYLNERSFAAATLPITDVLLAAGLEERNGEWGRSGETWATSSEGYSTVLLEELAADYRLDPAQSASFNEAVQMWRQWDAPRPQLDPAALLTTLGSGRTAAAFAEYWQPRTTTHLEAWMSQRRLVETLARTHPRSAVVNYLRGMIDLRLGDGGTAMDFFQMAHDADDTFIPAREELGTLLLDANQLVAALAILPPDSLLAQAVEAIGERATRDRTGAERSEPCRCGSGKKYKTCCAKELTLSQAERADLRDLRLQNFLSAPPWSVQMDRLADIVSTECGLMSFPEALAEPIVHDALVIEGGGAGAYLAARRSLLPDDECVLLGQFIARRRKAFDVAVVGSQLLLTHPDLSLSLQIPADSVDAPPGSGAGAFGGPENAFGPGDAVLVRTVELDGEVVASGPAIRIPATHVSLLRVTIGSRPTAEQLLGWICRRSEILRPPLDLAGSIDLRSEPSGPGASSPDRFEDDPVLAGIDLDDLARRALE